MFVSWELGLESPESSFVGREVSSIISVNSHLKDNA